jgi:hypothetical protein
MATKTNKSSDINEYRQKRIIETMDKDCIAFEYFELNEKLDNIVGEDLNEEFNCGFTRNI